MALEIGRSVIEKPDTLPYGSEQEKNLEHFSHIKSLPSCVDTTLYAILRGRSAYQIISVYQSFLKVRSAWTFQNSLATIIYESVAELYHCFHYRTEIHNTEMLVHLSNCVSLSRFSLNIFIPCPLARMCISIIHTSYKKIREIW